MGCRRLGKGEERTNSEGTEGGMERGGWHNVKKSREGRKVFFFFTKSFSESPPTLSTLLEREGTRRASLSDQVGVRVCVCVSKKPG